MRNPKQIRNRKSQIHYRQGAGAVRARPRTPRFGFSWFEFRDLFRLSDFGFRAFRPTLAIVFGALLTPSLHAQRNLTNIPDPDPEIERKSFLVADGFEVNLFAADPVLAKPIQMNFDPSGRLWVVSSEVYPQIQPGQTANDKVLVLEDADGDGRSDKTTVFADGLLIPTGIEPGDGGAYVANSTELLHFADTDNDGKADRRRVMLSGFGTEDTHHLLHTLRWGYDGQLYMNQSIYIHSHIETPHGVRRLGGGGIWEFRPETMELEVFIRGLVNPWGHHFDRYGQSFATDGAGNEGINYCLPGAYYASAPDAVRLLRGLNPGSPKDSGAEFVSGRHLPEAWQGNLLTNDFRGNRVVRYVISEDGAGFAARELAELIKTPHVAFRPIDVKMGPDGAIYIADWYNPIIQHGEVDFRDPRRDHTRGRIWRVTAKGRPLVERPRLVNAPIESLLERAAVARGLDPAAGPAGAQGAGSAGRRRGADDVGPGDRSQSPRGRADAARRPLDLPGARYRRAQAAGEPARCLRPAGAGGGGAGAGALARAGLRPAGTARAAGGGRPSPRPARGGAGARADPRHALGRAGAAGPRQADGPVPRLRALADRPRPASRMAAGGGGGRGSTSAATRGT